MLNYETILSNYDDKLTLMQWLKKVEAALENASATAFHVNKRGNATLTFSIDFEDGSTLESAPIVLQQGESVASARISNGHLILTLTNGDQLDAGVILSGNLNVSGNVTATGTIDAAKITGGEIVETMSGYSITNLNEAGFEISYASVVKNGNKLTYVVTGKFNIAATKNVSIADLRVPYEVRQKIISMSVAGASAVIFKNMSCHSSLSLVGIDVSTRLWDRGDRYTLSLLLNTNIQTNTDYFFRYEATILLSDNMI